MEQNFWLEKWDEPVQGFDQGRVNRSLELYFDRLDLQPGDSVFVPLCGRAYDMLWLAEKGVQVIGVELSEKAVRSFFEMHGLSFDTRIEGDFTVFESKNVRIYLGDFFAITSTHLQDIKGVYDRASLVAFPPEMREDYIQHMHQVVPKECAYLLVSLEFDTPGGPPFSLTDVVIEDLFTEASSLEKIGSKDLIEMEPRFQGKGCSYFLEKAHLIRL